MQNWTAPQELNPLLSRRIKMRPRFKILLLLTFLLSPAPSVFVMGAGLLEYYHRQILKERGVDTLASIVDWRAIHGRSGVSYDLAYKFEPTLADGRVGESVPAKANVSVEIFDRLQLATTIPIIYDSTNPLLSRLDLDSSVHSERPFDVMRQYIEGGVFSVLLGSVIWIILLRQYLIERRLLQWGTPAAAVILQEQEYPTRNGMRSKIRYRFTDNHNQTVENEQPNIPVKGERTRRMAEYRDEMMKNPTVLFDPDNSSKSRLYPLANVELVQT